MDYQSARLSGKPFKRKYHSKDAWLTTQHPGITGYWSKNAAFFMDRKAASRKCRESVYEPTESDLKADDWEIMDHG